MQERLHALADSDYAFIAFSGHGYFSKLDDATVLMLKRGETISAMELAYRSTKRTIILDCCREIRIESALLEYREKSATFSAETQRRSPDGQRCRDKFINEIRNASQGIVALHSCSPGQTAGDDERNGGHYTSCLLAGARLWADKLSDNTRDNQTHTYSVIAAHNSAEVSLKSRYGQMQTPWIDKPRTEENYFPFAVFA